MSAMHAEVIAVRIRLFPALAMGFDRAAGPGGSSAASGPCRSSGVRGTLIVDQGGPVVRECSAWPAYPLSGSVEAVRRDAGSATGPVAARADSDARGHFRLVLPPGEYVVQARNLTGAPVPTARPVTVRVTAGEFTEITIHFDSGIR
jgi:hypothetical protein